MKKRILSIFAFAFLTTLFTSACNSESNINGKFNKDEYIVSVDETINFFEEFVVEGAEKEEISYSSSNNEIISSQDGAIFKAKNSGSAYIFAKLDEKVVAQTKVTVKYRFSSPSNFKISDSGLLTWSRSTASVGGRQYYADKYSISYARIDNVINQDDIVYTTVERNEEKLQFETKGVYKIKIHAIGNETAYIENSAIVEETINNQVMGLIEGLKLENDQTFASQKATFSWNFKTNAKYDVYVEGLRRIEDLSINRFEFNFGAFNGNDQIKIEIVAKDSSEGGKLPTSTIFTLRKLSTPEVRFGQSATKDGQISWTGQATSKFKVSIENLQDSSIEEKIVEGSNVVETLEGMDAGFYNIKVMELGSNDNLTLNSKPFELITVNKLEVPQCDIELVGNKAVITFAENDYIKEYKIMYGNSYILFDTRVDGLVAEINDISSLAIGQQQIKVVALPTTQSGTVVPVYMDAVAIPNVINSNAYTFDFYLLDEISQVSHTIQGGINKISIPATANANYYKLYVGDIVVSTIEGEKTGLVEFSVDNLSNYQPVDDVFTLKVVAGRQEEGKSKAIEKVKTKTLKILPATTAASNQTNGFFSWNDVKIDGRDAECNYTYTIYRTNKDYVKLDGQEPIKVENVEGNQILTALETGYYTIEVISISTNLDEYLDSDYISDDNVLTYNFFVTQQIATPEVEFKQGQDNILNIAACDFAGKYTIYVDGELDGTITLNNPNTIALYRLRNTFDDVKNYKVSVVASGGGLYDEALYLDSAEKVIDIERISQASFTVSYEYDGFDRLEKENFKVSLPTNSVSVEVAIDGQEVSLVEHSYNMIDISSTEFEVSIVAKAKEGEGDKYYLDSLAKVVTFKRLAALQNIDFNNDEVVWDDSAFEIAKKYNVYFVIKNGENDNYHRLELDSTTTSSKQGFNLQTYIDNQIRTNADLESALRDYTSIEIQIYSFTNGYIDQTYYLQSNVGGTILGGDKLTVNKLSKPQLVYNEDTNVISWNEEIAGSVFDVYVDGSLYKENHPDNTLQIDTDQFLTTKSIQVVAKNEECLRSDISTAITIHKLAIASNLSVGNGVATFGIAADANLVKEVYINGSTTNVSYILGQDNAKFYFTDFVGEEDFEFQLIARDSTAGTYYIDSNKTTFTLKDLADCQFDLTQDGDILSWTDLSQNFIGNNANPVVYHIIVENDGRTYTIKQSLTTFNIQSIEEKINKTLAGGDVSITVKGVVENPYTLSSTTQTAVGFYGESDAQTFDTIKLKAVNVSNVTFVDSTEKSNAFENKQYAKIDLEFTEEWDGLDGTQIYAKLNGAQVVSAPTQNALNEKLSHTLYQMDDESFTLELQVVAPGYIISQSTSTSFSRLKDVNSLSVSETGILAIDDDQQNVNYYILLNVGTKTIAYDASNNKEINLLTESLLAQADTGVYTVKVIAYTADGNKLPSFAPYQITETKVDGIDRVEVTTFGDIQIELVDVYENLIFSAKVNGGESKEITPTLMEGEDRKFSIPVIDFMDVFGLKENFADNYNLQFTVREEGSIDASWVDVKLNYREDIASLVRGERMDKDYIIFAANEFSKNDTYFKVKVVSSEQENTYYVNGADKLGYWVTTADGGYFSEIEVENASQCYALSVNDILKDFEFGWVKIEIARVCDGDVITQFTQNTFESYKINAITSLGVNSSNILNIEWSNKDAQNDITPTGYYVYITREDGSQVDSFIEFVSGNSLDLKTLSLSEGYSYSISATAVYAGTYRPVESERDMIVVASDQTFAFDIFKYITPIKLGVQNGKLVFEENDFENSLFFQDIQNYFEGTLGNYAETVASREYGGVESGGTSPFYFSTKTLGAQTISLKFTKYSDDNGFTDQVYYMSILGYQLFPSKIITDTRFGRGSDNYIKLLQLYQEKIYDSALIHDIETSYMLSSLLETNFGVGGNDVLFDDLGNIIPAGKYSVTATHIGAGQNITSGQSQAIDMYVSPSPIKTAMDMVDVAGKNEKQYIVSFTSASIYDVTNSVYNTPQNYQMVFRLKNNGGVVGENKITFVIRNASGNWKIYLQEYDGENLVSEEEVLDGIYQGDETTFTVNMSALKYIEGIQYNQTYQVDVYALSGCDMAVLNGKSARLDIQFLAFDKNNISLSSGELWAKSQGTLQLRYKKENNDENEQIFDYQLSQGGTEIDFAQSYGAYDYILISLKGNIDYDKDEMRVESDIYMIENLYKYESPILDVVNGNLSLTKTTSGKVTFVVGAQEYSTKENESTIYITPTNKNSSHNVYIEGGNGSFNEKDSDNEIAKKILYIYGTSRIYLSSDISTINAQTLDEVSSISIDRGQFTFTGNGQTSADIVTLEAQADDDISVEKGIVVYKVTIDYYQKATDQTPVATEILYIEKLSTEAQILLAENINSAYNFYKVSISQYGAKVVVSGEEYTTIEGTKIKLSNALYYTGTAIKVLHSLETQSSMLNRTAVSTNLAISKENGLITFENTAILNGVRVYATYAETSVELTGTLTREGSVYTFKLDDGQLTSLTTGFELAVYAYEDGKILSSKLASSGSVYKLPNVTKDYYEVEIEEASNEGHIEVKTYISFEKYFNVVSLAGKYNIYKIVVNGEEISATSSKKRFLIEDGTTQLSVQVFDNQLPNEANKVTIICSDLITIDVFESAEMTENGDIKYVKDGTEYFLKETNIVWDSTKQGISWSWVDEEGNNADEILDGELYYYISAIISGHSESVIVDHNFYLPNRMGSITNFSVKVRKKSQTTDSVSTASQALTKVFSGININLFASGDGTESSPYEIANLEQFLNISKRNEQGYVYHFKLNTNLTIDSYLSTVTSGEYYGKTLNELIPVMYGVLDGNAKTINFTTSQIIEYGEFRTKSMSENDEYSFTKGFAMLSEVASTGCVKNLNVVQNIACSTNTNDNLIISTIAILNRGKIENVNVTEFNISTLNYSAISKVFFGGVAGVNYGTISKCINSSTFDYQTSSSFQGVIGYAGVCAFNQSNSSINGCFVENDKSISSSSSNATIIIGGNSIYNNGLISWCGNDSNLTAYGNATKYVAGLAIKCFAEGTMSYCYNNGTITGGTNIAGLIYSFTGYSSNLSYLVSTSSVQAICKSSAVIASSSNVYQPSGVSSSVSVKVVETLSQTENGNNLSVVDNGGYKASITLA